MDNSISIFMGAQWLSGSVLDSRPKGRDFEPHRRHCVVVLEQDTFILARKIRPCLAERLFTGRKESNQTNKLSAFILPTLNAQLKSAIALSYFFIFAQLKLHILM